MIDRTLGGQHITVISLYVRGTLDNQSRSILGGECMPIVDVNVWEGFGQKNARTVIQGVTKVFVEMGIPAHAVEVVVHEVPKSHWGVAGEPASEKLKDESVPR
jgi:4-oxalocrotonate tautomerase